MAAGHRKNNVQTIKPNRNVVAEKRIDDSNHSTVKGLVPAATPTAALTKGGLSRESLSEKGAGPMKLRTNNGQEHPFEGNQESWRQTFGTTDPDLGACLYGQLSLASPGTLLDRVKPDASSNASLASPHSIAPRDGLEAMLAVQMTAVHNHAMASLAKANQPGQPDAVSGAHVNQATKLMRTFAMQVDALGKYRHDGLQNMVVGEVHVHDGAQAIVSPVGRQGRAQDSERKDE
jgi:hypothetical protein